MKSARHKKVNVLQVHEASKVVGGVETEEGWSAGPVGGRTGGLFPWYRLSVVKNEKVLEMIPEGTAMVQAGAGLATLLGQE